MTTTASVPHHVSREPVPADRGLAFGRAQHDAIRHTVNTYERILLEDRGLDADAVARRGGRVERALRSYRPDLCEELAGIAAGAGVSEAVLYAVNARTELLSGGRLSGAIGGECSAVATVDLPRTRGVIGQTWDFHPALRASRVFWTHRSPDGASFTTFTEAGILAKIGVNSWGIAVTMNFLSTDEDGGDGGIPVHVVVRTVLEEAGTLEDARRLVEQAPANGSSCLTVAGPTRGGDVDVMALERWPGGVGIHAAASTPAAVAHTNHFLTPIAAHDALCDGPSGDGTRLRYERLRGVLAAGLPAELPSVCDVLSFESPGQPDSIVQRADHRRPWLERCETLATIIMEVPSATLWFREIDDPPGRLRRVACSP
jgi:isopenicillin-N N-acyltransferase like protein